MNNNLFKKTDFNKLTSANTENATISGMNARASCYLSKQKTVFSGDTADLCSAFLGGRQIFCAVALALSSGEIRAAKCT